MRICIVSLMVTWGVLAFHLHHKEHNDEHALDASEIDDIAAVASLSSQPMCMPYFDENLEPSENVRTDHRSLEKRGYYTCFNRATTSVNPADCADVITRIRNSPAAAQNLTVPAGLCLVWYSGTCLARLCAKRSVPLRGLARTAASVAAELEQTVYDRCVLAASPDTGPLDGVVGDCNDVNANCGSYRLSLEHHAGELVGGPPLALVDG